MRFKGIFNRQVPEHRDFCEQLSFGRPLCRGRLEKAQNLSYRGLTFNDPESASAIVSIHSARLMALVVPQ